MKTTTYLEHTIREDPTPLGLCYRVEGPFLNGAGCWSLADAKDWIRRERDLCATCRHDKHSLLKPCASKQKHGQRYGKPTGEACGCTDYAALAKTNVAL